MDVVNILDGVLGRIRHGPSHRFEFEHNNTLRLMDIDQLLRQYGINMYGRELDQADRLAFLVPKSQAVWAEYLLCRAGVPLTTALIDPRNERYSQAHRPGSMPSPWAVNGVGPATVVDRAVDAILRMFG